MIDSATATVVNTVASTLSTGVNASSLNWNVIIPAIIAIGTFLMGLFTKRPQDWRKNAK